MKHSLGHGGLTAEIAQIQPQEELDIHFQTREEGDITYLDLEFSSVSVIQFNETEVRIKLPFVDIHSCWTPGIIGNPISIRNKGICEWRYGFESKVSKLAPVACLYNINNDNKLTVALSDATESVGFHIGAYEEERVALVLLKLFVDDHQPRQNYQLSIRLDRRRQSYSQSIQDLSSWYEQGSYPHMPVPDSALQPVYSTWYAFHKNLSQDQVFTQCRDAKRLGCEVLILDDGWQAGDNDRDYKYCGDWQVDNERFPDMSQLVKGLHDELGMQCMLWLSVPFVGPCSEIWANFKEQILFYSHKNDAGVFDPRYPEVRQHIVSTCKRLLGDYNFDGLKLDFIDEFDMARAEGAALEPDERRDTESLEQAVESLLAEIRGGLEAINKDVLIEFRQSYMGPAVRNYGNILRVHDCPNDAIMNRMSIVDLRLLSGQTAVHSDMLIWSPEDTNESVSLHFINTLFAVQQISPDITALPQSQLQLVKHWLGFWQLHRDVLLNGELKAINPEMQYPVISSQKSDQKLVAAYANLPISVFNEGETKVTLVNGTMASWLYLDLHCRQLLSIRSFDCLGREQEKKVLDLPEGLSKLHLPVSGYAVITKH